MKIEKLKLENFRSHERTEMEFARWNFAVGRNATGKSSMQMAIEFLLTGRCSATGDAGRGAEDLIRLGAKDFKIAAMIVPGEGQPKTLTRCKSAHSHTFAINGAMVPIAQADAAIRNLLGVSTDVLSAVLDADRFVEMSEAEQKRILVSVLDVQPVTLPAEVAKDMQKMGFVNVPAMMARVTEIDQMHAHFFATRTSVKRTLKELGEMSPPDVLKDLPDSKLVWKHLQTLRDDLTALATRREGRVRAYENLVTRQKDLREEIERAEAGARIRVEEWSSTHAAKVQDMELEIQAAKEAILTSADEKRLMEIEGRAPAVKQMEKELARVQAEINESQRAIDEVVNLKAASCPTCHRALSLKQKGEIQEALQRGQDALAAEADKLRAALEKAGDPEKAREALKPHRAAVVALSRLKRDLAEQENQMGPHLADLEQQITAAKKKLETLPAMEEPNTGDLDSEMAVLVERITNGEALLDRVKSIEAEQAAWKQWAAQREKREREVEALDRLCDYFGPNGVKTRMVGGKFGPFANAVDFYLSRFHYGCVMSMEPYSFQVIRGHERLSPGQLSESERFRFGVAFQIALAMATGVRFVVIDRADVLDGESRQALTQLLIASELDQAIVLSTSDSKLPPKEALPEGVKFIALGREDRQTVTA